MVTPGLPGGNPGAPWDSRVPWGVQGPPNGSKGILWEGPRAPLGSHGDPMGSILGIPGLPQGSQGTPVGIPWDPPGIPGVINELGLVRLGTAFKPKLCQCFNEHPMDPWGGNPGIPGGNLGIPGGGTRDPWGESKDP